MYARRSLALLAVLAVSLSGCASLVTPIQISPPPAPVTAPMAPAGAFSTPLTPTGPTPTGAALADLEHWTDPATYPAIDELSELSDPSQGDASAWRPEKYMTPAEGTKSWQIAARPGRDSYAIAGFSDKPSYVPGATMKISVSTPAASYSVTFWRLDGTGALTDPFVGPLATLTGLPGSLQGAAIRQSKTKMTYTNWTPSASFAIPADWLPGIYLARLDSGHQSYIPFIIRSTKPAKYTVVVPVLTWQAYNRWGGASLYWTAAKGLGDKSSAVSFNRPYELSFGASRLFVHGYIPFVGWLNKSGLDIGWTTDYDLTIAHGALPSTRALIFIGHTEYWPTTLRSWIDSRLAAGAFGLAYFSADGAYWPCTMASSNRVLHCPKSRNYRDAPYNNPEQKLFGSMYGFVTAGAGTFRVSTAAKTAGLLRGTGLRVGSSLGSIAAGEVDQMNPHYPNGGAKIVASAIHVPSLTNAGSRYIGVHNAAHMTIRSLANGRRVFSAASIDFVWAFAPGYAKVHGVPVAAFDRFVRNIFVFVGH